MQPTNGQSNGKLNGKREIKNQIQDELRKDAEQKFLDSDLSLLDFAKDNELSYSMVTKWSMKYNWRKKRARLSEEALLAGKPQFDNRCMDLMESALDQVETLLPDSNKNELAGLVGTVERIQAVKYRAMNVPLPKQVIDTGEVRKSPYEISMEDIKEKINETLQEVESGK